MLRIDCGRRLMTIGERPCVIETIATAAADKRPASCGYRIVSSYISPAFGALTLWARSTPPAKEPSR